MNKRLSVSDILTRNGRRGNGNRGSNFFFEVQDLRNQFLALEPDSPLIDFFPIRLSTIVEVTVKESVKQLVDFSPAYAD